MRYQDLARFGRKRRHGALLGVPSDACALLSGLGLGVGLMYFLDANSGKKRRKVVIDKLGSWTRSSASAVEGVSLDARNRLKGVAHEAAKLVKRPEPATGLQLAAQIRSRMGHLVSHPHAIDVSAEEGRVVLEGPILAKEADALVSAVARMRGVDHVDDRLSRFESAEGVPALQSGKRPNGDEAARPSAAWEGF